MNGRYASLIASMISRRSTSAKRAGEGSKSTELLFAMAIVACFWAARISQGQIEVDAFVTNLGSNDVSVINLSSGTTNTIALSPTAGGPVGVAVTPDGRFAYITNGGIGPDTTGGTTVSVIDVATKTLLPTPITVGLSPAGVAVTPDAKFAYVTNKGGVGTVSVIDTMTNSVATTIQPLVPGLQGIAITPDGKLAYVADGFGPQHTVSVIDTATNTALLPPITVGANPVAVAISPDGQTVYVTNSGNNTVTAIKGSTNTVIQLDPPGPSTMVGIAVTPDGKSVYVSSASPLNNTVSVIDATHNTVSQTLTMGNQPAGVSLTPDGKLALVANFGGHTVSEIKTGTNTVIEDVFTVGTAPIALGSFIGPNIIVQGAPLPIASDSDLTPLGFGTFVDFNGGTLQTTGNLDTTRTISLLALGGIVDTNGFWFADQDRPGHVEPLSHQHLYRRDSGQQWNISYRCRC
jgi:YVTN family beta-propeller protein